MNIKHLTGLSAAIASMAFATLAAAQDAVKIGVMFPIKTIAGQQSREGAEMAAEMLNKQGGVLGKKVELIVYDSNSQPVDGVAAAQRLIQQDRVKFLAGEFNSTVALAVLQVVRANDAMYVISVPKHPDLTKSGYDKVFRMNSPFSMDSDYENKRIAEVLKPTKLAIVAENTDYGRYMVPLMKKYFGDKVVLTEMIELSQNDLTTAMTKVKASGADVVCLFTGKTEQTAIALRALDTLGVNAKKCTATSVLNTQSLRLAGAAGEGATGPTMYSSLTNNPVNLEFVKEFNAKYKRDPEAFEALAFETVWVTGKGMIAAGSTTDTAKVAAAIHKGSWQTPRGNVKFDEGGQALAAFYANLVAKNGKLVLAD